MYKKNIWQKNVQNINWKQKNFEEKVKKKNCKKKNQNWIKRKKIGKGEIFWKQDSGRKKYEQNFKNKSLDQNSWMKKKTGEQKFYTKIGELITADN